VDREIFLPGNAAGGSSARCDEAGRQPEIRGPGDAAGESFRLRAPLVANPALSVADNTVGLIEQFKSGMLARLRRRGSQFAPKTEGIYIRDTRGQVVLRRRKKFSRE
jgi:hypothetical protein